MRKLHLKGFFTLDFRKAFVMKMLAHKHITIRMQVHIVKINLRKNQVQSFWFKN